MIASALGRASEIVRRTIPTAELVEHGSQGPSEVANSTTRAGRFRLSAVLRNGGRLWAE